MASFKDEPLLDSGAFLAPLNWPRRRQCPRHLRQAPHHHTAPKCLPPVHLLHRWFGWLCWRADRRTSEGKLPIHRPDACDPLVPSFWALQRVVPGLPVWSEDICLAIWWPRLRLEASWKVSSPKFWACRREEGSEECSVNSILVWSVNEWKKREIFCQFTIWQLNSYFWS